jgi:hypothetical protein
MSLVIFVSDVHWCYMLIETSRVDAVFRVVLMRGVPLVVKNVVSSERWSVRALKSLQVLVLQLELELSRQQSCRLKGL